MLAEFGSWRSEWRQQERMPTVPWDCHQACWRVGDTGGFWS
jgi:hypothetical protein